MYILVIKSPSGTETDDYVDELTREGYDAVLKTAIVFEFVNIDLLREHLNNPDQFGGVVVTSPRCVDAIALAIECNDSSLHVASKWSQKSVYAVGKKTAEKLLQLGFTPKGSHSGNAEKLSLHIVEEFASRPINKKLLYPCGNLRRDFLTKALKEQSIGLEEVEVYRTHPSPKIKDELSALFYERGYPRLFAYFSPSAVQACCTAFSQLNINIQHFQNIAIGQTTASSLVASGMNVLLSCNEPSPCSLVESIKSLVL